MTLMTSALTMVDSRWAMAMWVRVPMRASRAFWTSRSLAVSSAEVAFVHDQDARGRAQDPGDGQALFLAAGQAVPPSRPTIVS